MNSLVFGRGFHLWIDPNWDLDCFEKTSDSKVQGEYKTRDGCMEICQLELGNADYRLYVLFFDCSIRSFMGIHPYRISNSWCIGFCYLVCV